MNDERPPHTLPAEGFVGRETIEEMIGVSRSGLWMMIRDGRFPPPDYRVRRLPRWNVKTFRKWLDEHSGGDPKMSRRKKGS